ncbi:MAG: hypothetical protein KDC80_08705 [Saprospiraceae bacterium]|nr:hypothetical protein [Saprospiraceae bacterium]
MLTNKKVIAASAIVLFLVVLYWASSFLPKLIILSRDISVLIFIILLILVVMYVFYRLIRILVRE